MSVADRFVCLHRHDQYSLWDGLDLAARAADRAVALDQPALALTNHGNVLGLVEHYRACTDRGIKPILGMEGYITFTTDKPASRKLSHITLLVENATGYRNLMRLVTATQDLIYYKPRMSVRMLLEHADGLIVLSGCPSGLVSRLILAGKADDADRLFGVLAARLRGRFYAEIQHSHPKELGQAVVALADKYRVPLVMTNDAHYVAPEDRAVHDLMLQMRFTGKAKGEDNPTYGEGYFIPNRADATALMMRAHPWMKAKDLAAALDRTVDIAARVDFTFTKPKHYLPRFWPDPERQFSVLVARAIRDHGLAKRRPYLERAKRELDLILGKGYAPYFMVCWEFVQQAKKEGILVGPRGSVCGSLIAYILGITQVDPLIHGTMFERFLHEDRKTMPDVDMDIDSRYQNHMIDWVKRRFAPHAIPIITVGRYSAQSLANDLAKVYRLDEQDRGDLAFAIGDLKWRRVYAATEDDLRNAKRGSVFDHLEQRHKGFKRAVIKLFSQARYVGQHPGGICFVPEKDPTSWLAVVRPKVDAQPTTCYNFVDVEYLGLLKFDFLGLGAMGVVAQACELVKDRYGETIRLADIPLDDGALFDRFARGDADGIFQFETSGGRQYLRDIRPSVFQELAAATALNRPGVSENLAAYVEGKAEGQHTGAFAETYGVVVYQENIMQYLRGLGFTWGESDIFIKTIKGSGIQKLTSPEVKAVYEKFIQAHLARGRTKADTERLMDRLTKYSFNKAHAVAYALVAYWQMWLRVNYPMEFWCAMLNLEGNDDKRMGYERSAVKDGCLLLPPNFNASAHYRVEDDAIRVGLSSIKDVGAKAAAAIIAGQPYSKPSDIRRVPKRQANSRVIRALIRAGALHTSEEKHFEEGVRYNRQRGYQRRESRY